MAPKASCAVVGMIRLLAAAAAAAGLLLAAVAAPAAQVTVSWDANSETDLAGYKVYWGTASRNYQWNSDVGNETSFLVTGLAEGSTYYFAATAYDIWGNESGYSNEVSHAVAGVPEVAVAGNGQAIADGDAVPGSADGTDFGTVTLAGAATATFAVSNAGTGPLTLTGNPRVAVSGAAASDFVVTAQPASPVSAGGSTTFQVRFSPSAAGLRTATLSMASDDADENPYDFAVQGTGSLPPAPEMNVLGNGQLIASGDATPSAADHTEFGTVSILGQSLTRTFTVQNAGNAALELNGNPRVQVSGANAAEFTIVAQPATPVAAGASTSFQVRFTPAGEGLRRATLSTASNDADENPYVFAVQGTGLLPAETVSAPASPAGPSSGPAMSQMTYSTGGSVSNWGDAVQYLFDWGDGTDSGWLPAGNASASKSWSAAGEYPVRAKARCAAHTSAESSWSASLVVTVTRDTTPPAPPSGLRVSQN